MKFRYGLVAVGLGLLLWWMFRPAIPLPYLSDDYEHLQLTSEIRAGLRPWLDLVTIPFHGQLLILLRLLFWFGKSMAWVRVGVLIAHGLAALGCGILCRRWTNSDWAGVAGAALYAGAAGFSGDLVTWPSSAIFCLGAVFFIWALVALDEEKFGLSVGLFAASWLGMNAEIAGAVTLWLLCGRREWRKAYLAVAFVLAVIWRLATRSDRLAAFSLTPRGAALSGWMMFTAPFRFAVSWTNWSPDFRQVEMWSAVAWLPLIASWWLMSARQRRILLALWAPAVLIACLTGFGRASLSGTDRYGPGVLYVADRYYYPFLLPLVATVAFVIARVRWATIAVAALLAGSRAHYIHGIPFSQYDTQRGVIARGERIVASIQPPVTLRDVRIPMDGAHRNRVSLAFLIYSQHPDGIPGVKLTNSASGAELPVDSRLGEPIDFSQGSFEESLESGFSWWDKPFRWVIEPANVRLRRTPGDLLVTAYAPVDQFHRPMSVSVEINGKPAGQFTILKGGVQQYRIAVPSGPAGELVTVTLRPDYYWHARGILPGSFDDRDLSFALESVKFGE